MIVIYSGFALFLFRLVEIIIIVLAVIGLITVINWIRGKARK